MLCPSLNHRRGNWGSWLVGRRVAHNAPRFLFFFLRKIVLISNACCFNIPDDHLALVDNIYPLASSATVFIKFKEPFAVVGYALSQIKLTILPQVFNYLWERLKPREVSRRCIWAFGSEYLVHSNGSHLLQIFPYSVLSKSPFISAASFRLSCCADVSFPLSNPRQATFHCL